MECSIGKVYISNCRVEAGVILQDTHRLKFELGRLQSFEFAVRDGLRHRNRGALGIVNSILKACLNGALKTHVLYKCNLSSRQVGRYLEFLLK